MHDLGRLEGLGLPADLDVDLVTLHRVDHGLVEAALAIRHPDRFLGVCSRKKFRKLKNTNKSISPYGLRESSFFISNERISLLMKLLKEHGFKMKERSF